MRKPDDAGDANFLTVQVAGDRDQPERLLMISRPEGGRVWVREWTSTTWNAQPEEREVDAGELLDAFERAGQARRRLSHELYYIRAWLDGTAP